LAFPNLFSEVPAENGNIPSRMGMYFFILAIINILYKTNGLTSKVVQKVWFLNNNRLKAKKHPV
jgi:hypothetical protein